ncbi:MAG TPA: dioxygenase [Stellaceae bacterium]
MPSLIGSQLTDDVVARYKDCADPRLKEIMVSLIKHLHSFSREVKLSEAEWIKGIEFLTAVGHITDDMRQEFILLSDVLGLSMTVVELNHGAEAGETEATVQGPFYVPGAPELPKGASVDGNPPGDPLDVTGVVHDAKGKPIAHALIDVWQAGEDGLYSNQDPNKPKFELRGKFRSDRDGTYHFKSVLPKGYQIPTDGPVGALMRATNRPAWRPAHLHFMVSAEGYKPLTTHLFVKGTEHIREDAVFGVKESLIVDFQPVPGKNNYTLHHDFGLSPRA